MNLADVIRMTFAPDSLPPRLVAGPPELPATRPLPRPVEPESWDDLDEADKDILRSWAKHNKSKWRTMDARTIRE